MAIKEFKGERQKASVKAGRSQASKSAAVATTAKPVVRPEEFAAALAGAVRGERPLPDWAGKRVYASPEALAFWESEETGASSLSSFARLIGDNKELLLAIERGDATSVAEVAKKIGRAQPNVSRSLSKLEKYGVVSLHKSEGRTKQVEIAARHMRFDLDVLSGKVTLVPGDHVTTAPTQKTQRAKKSPEDRRAVARPDVQEEPARIRRNTERGIRGSGRGPRSRKD